MEVSVGLLSSQVVFHTVYPPITLPSVVFHSLLQPSHYLYLSIPSHYPPPHLTISIPHTSTPPLMTGRFNPYCEVIIDDQKSNVRTDTLKNTLNPKWNEEFTVYVCMCDVYVWHVCMCGMCVCMACVMCMCVCIYMYVCMCVLCTCAMCTCVCACVHMCAVLCMYICICTCVLCVYVCCRVYIHTHTHTLPAAWSHPQAGYSSRSMVRAG